MSEQERVGSASDEKLASQIAAIASRLFREGTPVEEPTQEDARKALGDVLASVEIELGQSSLGEKSGGLLRERSPRGRDYGSRTRPPEVAA